MAIDPFFVFSLPRSRSKWMSVFLSYGEWVCCHDPMLDLKSIDALVDLTRHGSVGVCDTAMAFAAPAIRKVLPGAKFVVIRRDIEEVRSSLDACGLGPYPDGMLEALAAEVDAVSSMPGTLTIGYADLDENGCRQVFEHCLGEPFDRDWWVTFANKNIQIDVAARVKKCEAALPVIHSFANDARDVMEMVSIQEESWYDFAIDGFPVIYDHYHEVGSYEHEVFDPNVPLLEACQDSGILQIVTARAGRKLVGYLFFTLAPSFKSRNEMNATQGAFYVKPGWRGWTGLAMHKESIRLLKEKGVKRLALRSGAKGVGERQDVLFRRLGAVEDGHLFNLWIGD